MTKTLPVPDELHAMLKIVAAHRRMKLSQLHIMILNEWLKESRVQVDISPGVENPLPARWKGQKK